MELPNHSPKRIVALWTYDLPFTEIIISKFRSNFLPKFSKIKDLLKWQLFECSPLRYLRTARLSVPTINSTTVFMWILWLTQLTKDVAERWTCEPEDVKLKTVFDSLISCSIYKQTVEHLFYCWFSILGHATHQITSQLKNLNVLAFRCVWSK